MNRILLQALHDWSALLPQLASLSPQLQKLGDAMLACWQKRGKVLIIGNGGSAADAMHLAEELSVRYQKNRRALAAVALCDASAITCTGNDFSFNEIFSRQVDALGNVGDILISLSSSGNSTNLLLAVDRAKVHGMTTAAFLGKGGGALLGKCDIELLIPSNATARVQEAQKLLYHVLCEWIDSKVD